MKPLLRRVVAVTITVTYAATQVVFGSVAESNFWSARRNSALKSAHAAAPVQVASLPAAMRAGALMNQLPSARAALPTVSAWSHRKNAPRLSPALASLADAIPLGNGTIQEVHDVPGGKTPVLLLQDVPAHAEAQTNSAAILEALVDGKNAGLVAVEGAFSAFDFSRFRAFTDKETVRAATEDLLQQGVISAPSFAAINSVQAPPLFLGVDHPRHYKANVDAYLSTRGEKAALDEALKKFGDQLEAAK
jgi:hypothetical protein